VQYYWHFADTW